MNTYYLFKSDDFSFNEKPHYIVLITFVLNSESNERTKWLYEAFTNITSCNICTYLF